MLICIFLINIHRFKEKPAMTQTAKRHRIRITLTHRIDPKECHRGHKPGDSWDIDTITVFKFSK